MSYMMSNNVFLVVGMMWTMVMVMVRSDLYYICLSFLSSDGVLRFSKRRLTKLDGNVAAKSLIEGNERLISRCGLSPAEEEQKQHRLVILGYR
jgi:hypothetical protein